MNPAPSTSPLTLSSSSQLSFVKLRISYRTTKPPIWLNDYVSSKKPCLYPMTNYVCYDHLALTYRASLAYFFFQLFNPNPLLKLARILSGLPPCTPRFMLLKKIRIGL